MNKYYLWILVIATLLSACNRNEHEESIKVGDVAAHIQYQTPWLGDNEVSEAVYQFKSFSLFGKVFYHTLDEDFFKKQLEITYNPGDYGGNAIMAFPHKRMLVLGLSVNDGHSIVGISEKNGVPHLDTLAGCFPSGSGAIFTRLGRQASSYCYATSDKTDLKDYGVYYKKLQISEHEGYWIDYLTEDVYEIPNNSFSLEGACLNNPHAADAVIGVAGLDGQRKQLLMLYRTKVKNTFNLCAITAARGAADSSYQCFNFKAKNPPPENIKFSGKISPPVPASLYMKFDIGDDQAVEQRAKWISTYFDFESNPNGTPLGIKPDTKVLASASGVIPRDQITFERERDKNLCTQGVTF